MLKLCSDHTYKDFTATKAEQEEMTEVKSEAGPFKQNRRGGEDKTEEMED